MAAAASIYLKGREIQVSVEQRVGQLEDDFETVKQLLISAARHAESANEGLDRLTERQDQTQRQLDQLAIKVDTLTDAQTSFITEVQRVFGGLGERVSRLEGIAERLEGVIQYLDRNYQTQQAELQEFRRTTNASLERMDRILDYLLKKDQD
jgi:chromosome segregation ATPase